MPTSPGYFAASVVDVLAVVTVIENGARALVEAPSLTLITIFGSLPASLAEGVPLKRPVAAAKAAHVGAFCIENVRVAPAASVVVGVKMYAVPTVTVVCGVPEIDSAAAAVTVIENGARALLEAPSLTLIMMFE